MSRNFGHRVMKPCTCEKKYAECNCEWLAELRSYRGLLRRPIHPAIYMTLWVLGVSMLIIGFRYLFG